MGETKKSEPDHAEARLINYAHYEEIQSVANRLFLGLKLSLWDGN